MIDVDCLCLQETFLSKTIDKKQNKSLVDELYIWVFKS